MNAAHRYHRARTKDITTNAEPDPPRNVRNGQQASGVWSVAGHVMPCAWSARPRSPWPSVRPFSPRTTESGPRRLHRVGESSPSRRQSSEGRRDNPAAFFDFRTHSQDPQRETNDDHPGSSLTPSTSKTSPLPRFNVTRSDWWDQAACRDPTGASTGLFFSDELHDIAQAKRICADLPGARLLPRGGHRAA